MRLLAKLFGAVIPLSIIFSAPVYARDWNAIQKSGTIKAATEGAFAGGFKPEVQQRYDASVTAP